MDKNAENPSLKKKAPARSGGLEKKERLLWIAAGVSIAALIVVSVLLTGGPDIPESAGPAASIAPRESEPVFSSPTGSGGPAAPVSGLESHLDEIAEAFNSNSDTVGWLCVPGLSELDRAVVHSSESNSYYLYRDALGNKLTNNLQNGYHLNGAYYTHFRNTFGARGELSKNTVIFGHSDLGLNIGYADDDPSGTLFSQLYSFLDEDFARATPYVYFSTAEEDMAWEVFAVYYTDAGTDYIEPEPGSASFEKLLKNARARSRFDYDVPVGPADRILTLSTCTVHFGLSAKDDYRFVLMAKLIDPADAVKDQASLTVNPDIDERFKG